MLAPLVLASLASLLPAQSGGELTFPDGPADPGTIRVRVVDRNRVPLAHATVRGVLETSDVAAWIVGADEGAGLLALTPAVSADDGTATLQVPARGWCAVVVERPGFAPGSFLPLFAGRSYELVLDFGARLRLVAEDEEGVRRPAELLISFERFPQLPHGLRCERLLHTGAEGTVDVDFVPRGPVEVEALGDDGSRGSLRLSVGSAWRSNALVFQPASRVVLHPTEERVIPIADRDGTAIEGLQARLIGVARLGTSVVIEPGFLRVRGVAQPFEPDVSELGILHDEGPERVRDIDAMIDDAAHALAVPPVAIELWAPGYRSFRLDCAGASPPSAFTFRYATRGVTLPTAPGDGTLWIPGDPYDYGSWRSIDVTRDRLLTVDTAEDVPLVAALVDAGRVTAWVTSVPGAESDSGRWIEPATIVARVTVDGAPVRCALVKLELVAAGGDVPAVLRGKGHYAYADPDGVLEFGGLCPGRWSLTLETGLVSSEGASCEVDVFEGERREVELAATRGLDVPGRVVDADGEPIGAGFVRVVGLDATVVDGIWPVAEDGTFLATGLVDGFGYELHWSEVPSANHDGIEWVYRTRDGRPPRKAELELVGALPDELVIVVAAATPGGEGR